MDELISRQAAIDALKELTANGTNKGMVFGEDTVHRIEMLPSAQPEIIRCKDCEASQTNENGIRWCFKYGSCVHIVSDDFYCAFGRRAKRREE